MDEELNLLVSLFTPVSDLAFAEPDERLEATFGRRGNDTIYAFSRNSTPPSQNIDLLFGDLFDNSPAEFEIIINIQNTGQGGNPFLILERNIPSVGRDRHILGDSTGAYYLGDPNTLTTTNLFGTNEFAFIYDFDPSQDRIQLNGSAQDYVLLELEGLQIEGIQQPFAGEAIFSLRQGVPDLVGFVLSKPEVDLSLTANYFQYVGNQPPKKPAQRRAEQLGGPGVDLGLDTATDPAGNVYVTGTTTGTIQSGTSPVGASDFWVAKYDRNGNQTFIRQFGTSESEAVLDVATDSAGNIYLAGSTQGNLFGPLQSSQDAWIAKYDPNGNLLWGRQFGANLTSGFANGANALDVDAQGNVTAVGLGIKNNDRQDILQFAVQDDTWVARFDTNGNQQWFNPAVRAPGATFPFDISPFFDEAYDVAADANGNAYVVGWTQGLVREADPSRNLSKYDVFLAKLDPNGQVQWLQQLGSQDQGLEFPWGVDVDSQGNVYATGWTTGNFQAGSQANPAYDIWLARFNPADGTPTWIRQFGTPGDDGSYLADMDISAQDAIYISGYTNDRISGRGRNRGENDAWVARFDTAGNNQWIQQFGSAGTDYATGVSVDNSTGRVNVTGFTDGPLGRTNTEAVDAWFVQLDARRGRLQRVTGSARERIAGDESGTAPIQAPQIAPSEQLPAGDNRINPSEGVPGGGTVDPRRVEAGLVSLFDASATNSVSGVLGNAVRDDFANFLNPSGTPAPAPTPAPADAVVA
ncbi:Beta-propeller repeat protein [Pleurocapsa sp. PCC 7327]|uniref:SBBP repeat-containing protein n=1 Tax=Pleurocapsa sp. PCC 7327 TaxID=118163 RepID=UPI00029F820E|nr:SBBP repeat-containing protein [Pleurocapsa sp. PCC 7327]AFY75717.1 Beta-propeller repeat protein [Pleurocapsa sp. PCC 7327]